MNTILILALLLLIAGLAVALAWTLREIYREIVGQDDEFGVVNDD